MNSLKDKLIFVTGGSQGIGAVVARKCAQEGAKVIIAARTEDDLKKIVAELNASTDTKHEYRVIDVGNKETVKKLSEELKANYGYIDGLVNCAGIYGPIGRIDAVDIGKFIEAIQINFLGTVFTCHYLTPLLKKRHGKIVNFSGGGAAGLFPFFSAYSSSKTAIVRFTENIAEELAEYGITANAIAPGFVATRIHQDTLIAGENAGVAFLESTKKQLEAGGTSPEKAANLSAFLLSEQSNGITGKFISAQWDPWEQEEWREQLKLKKNLATLRRIDEKYFYEKV